MLHIAPEEALEKQLSSIVGLSYLTADIKPDRAMVQMDVTDIRKDANCFDVIYCSHVLEHVPDDHRALREFFRVLKPGGWALLIVPVKGETTFEDPSVKDPSERERLFGKRDHVRVYGMDFANRVRSAGFFVSVLRPSDILGDVERCRMGISKGTTIFYAVKPAGQG